MRSDAASASTIVVLGGAGAMGRITVRDLCETAPEDVRIVVADVNGRAANALVKRLRAIYQRPNLSAVATDITRPAMAARQFRGAFGIINCCQHAFNLAAMDVALRIGAHYTDLGGLFHVTRQQLRLHRAFKAKRRLALLGMGAAPGIVNVLARHATDRMTAVREIHVVVGGVDRAPARAQSGLPVSYSIATVLDEASMPAAVFTNGRFRFVEPMSDTTEEALPLPVGTVRASRTLHSEVATLPLSYRRRGVREVSFKIAFPPVLDERLRFLRSLGLLEQRPVRVGRAHVVPRDVLMALLQTLPQTEASGPPDEHEVLRVTVRGERDGRAVESVLDCHVPGLPDWGVGIDMDTGCPPSIAMQMMKRGEITAVGVLPAEMAVPPDPFIRELERRGMRVDTRETWQGGV